MAENKIDKCYAAFLSINAIRENIDSISIEDEVSERYIKEFHDALDILEADGIDPNLYRIPEKEIKRRFVKFVGKIQYSSAKYVPKALLVAKINALITYLQFKNHSLYAHGEKVH